jgi:hypothetical protein
MGLGSEIRKKLFPDPGSGTKKAPKEIFVFPGMKRFVFQGMKSFTFG